MGKTRAKIDDTEHKDTRSVLNIQAHGDAAFCGQGAAYEGLTLCNLPKFDIGGSIHIITNKRSISADTYFHPNRFFPQ